MNAEQFLFLKAIETFKAANNKHYPNWTDVLEVVRLLGYRKTLGKRTQPARRRRLDRESQTPPPMSAHERASTHKRKKAA